MSESRVRGLRADPLAPVLALGESAARAGLIWGLIGALVLHGALAFRAGMTLSDLDRFARSVRDKVAADLRSQIDIDVAPPPPPPPPAPEPPLPEPEPEPAPPPPPPVKVAVPRAAAEPPPPPAAAQAGKVLAQEPDPDELVDLTGNSFVVGNSDRFAGGVTASTGTANTAVRDVRARPSGVGTAPPGPVSEKAAPSVDRSRPASLVVSGNWNDCGFPPEADIEGINFAIVQLSVTVGPDGRPQAVTILKDPGNGFGRLARTCAMRKQYQGGLDRYGKPIAMTTPPFTVKFNR